MQQTQQHVEELERGSHRGAVHRLTEGGLHGLEIPCRELLPEQTVEHHHGVAQTELGEVVLDGCQGVIELVAEPLYSLTASLGLLNVGYLPTLNETEGIPNLVVEVAALLTQCVIIEDVVAGRSSQHQTHAHTVGTKFLDQAQRIG